MSVLVILTGQMREIVSHYRAFFASMETTSVGALRSSPQSTTEAEIIAATEALKEGIWVKKLLGGMNIPASLHG